MNLRTTLVLSILGTLAAAGVHAQTAVIDEGAFRLTVRGSAVGTETFTIRRSGSGASATTVAEGRVLLDTGERTRVVLQLQGPERRPTAYQIETQGDGRKNITGRSTGNRFRATIVSGAGEEMREYLVGGPAVVLHDALVYPHHFLATAALQNGRIRVILADESRQVEARVAVTPDVSVEVAGQS